MSTEPKPTKTSSESASDHAAKVPKKQNIKLRVFEEEDFFEEFEEGK